MNTKVLGIVLVGLGVLLFAYQGITYKTREKVIDLGAIEVTEVKKRTFPFSPVAGGVALVGGVVLLLCSKKRIS